MPISNDERRNLNELTIFLLDLLDVKGKPATAARQLPPLTNNRLPLYIVELETYWRAMIVNDLGINPDSDPTAYDACDTWGASWDWVMAQINALSLGKNNVWHHVDPRVTALARFAALIAATAVCATGGPP